MCVSNLAWAKDNPIAGKCVKAQCGHCALTFIRPGGAMYYILNENFRLRGWEKLPYCVIESTENTVSFLNAAAFEALSLCDGNIDVSLPIISEETRAILKKLEQQQVVRVCRQGEKLQKDQEYHKYGNRFIYRAHWSITGRCNYRCKHCYMSAPQAKFGELSHEVVMSIVDQLADCGVIEVSLTGGEALLRSDFFEIVEALTQRGIRISQVYSNGKLVTKERLARLQDYGQKPEFNMSYDGDEGWHDWMRGIEDAGRIVLDAFDLCHQMGFSTGAEMCLHRGNVHLLRESINTLADHHCAHVKTNPVSATELWNQFGQEYTISLEEVMESYLQYIPAYFEDGMRTSLQLGGFFQCRKGTTKWDIPSIKYKEGQECPNAVICGHARQTLYISAEGRMLPCMPLSSFDIQKEYPSILETGLRQGLVESSYMRLIDTRLSEYIEKNKECTACAFRWQCGGGCRASALATTPNDIMAPDRSVCLLLRGGYVERIKEAAENALRSLSYG